MKLTHDTISFYARPFLRGMGPVFRFDFTPYSDGSMHVDVHVLAFGPAGRTCIFSSDDYRPGLRRNTRRQWAADVVGFAVAYVERPVEFERSDDDTEQAHSATWGLYGDALSCALESGE